MHGLMLCWPDTKGGLGKSRIVMEFTFKDLVSRPIEALVVVALATLTVRILPIVTGPSVLHNSFLTAHAHPPTNTQTPCSSCPPHTLSHMAFWALRGESSQTTKSRDICILLFFLFFSWWH